MTRDIIASFTYQPPYPERTAHRRATAGVLDFDRRFHTWPSRAAMCLTIRLQQRREPRPDDWRPCVPLADGE